MRYATQSPVNTKRARKERKTKRTKQKQKTIKQ